MVTKKTKKLITFAQWLAFTIVSLAVSVGVIDGVLAVPYIGSTLNVVAGWVAVISTIIAVIGKIMKAI